MNLTNVANTPEDVKEYDAPVAGDAPKYPYGLELCLRDSTLKKLGITTLPAVGETLMVMAKVTVTSVRSSQQLDGDKESGCDMQITDMSLSAPVREVDPKSFYPKSGYTN